MALRSLSSGMTGPEVVAIQEGLNRFYNRWLLEPDGVFGNETNKVMCRFQKEQGMVSPDGLQELLRGQPCYPSKI